MAKILGICGSPRKAATAYALDQAMEAAGQVSGIETEKILLAGKKLNFCIHCNKCVKEGVNYCSVFKDDMSEFYDTFYNADGYIIASPVYEMNITAQLAAFFNRFRPTYTILRENPSFFSKKVGCAITVGGTRNGGQEMAINAIYGFYNTQGITPINGGLGMYAGASVWSKDQGAEGAKADEKGMESCRAMGKKVAEMALLMNP